MLIHGTKEERVTINVTTLDIARALRDIAIELAGCNPDYAEFDWHVSDALQTWFYGINEERVIISTNPRVAHLTKAYNTLIDLYYKKGS